MEAKDISELPRNPLHLNPEKNSGPPNDSDKKPHGASPQESRVGNSHKRKRGRPPRKVVTPKDLPEPCILIQRTYGGVVAETIVSDSVAASVEFPTHKPVDLGTVSSQPQKWIKQSVQDKKQVLDADQHKGSQGDENFECVAATTERTAKALHTNDQLQLVDENEFSVFDLVWGKVRKHPWWPGQIFDSSHASTKAIRYKKPDSFLVAYFGDGSFAWNKASVLKPFKMHFSEVVEKQSCSEEVKEAIDCALEEVSRRVELGLACSCIHSDAYDKLRFQIVDNCAILSESRKIEFIDKSSKAISFQPAKLLEYVKTFAQSASRGVDQLDLVVAKSQLVAFYRFKHYCHLPDFPGKNAVTSQSEEGMYRSAMTAEIGAMQFSNTTEHAAYGLSSEKVSNGVNEIGQEQHSGVTGSPVRADSEPEKDNRLPFVKTSPIWKSFESFKAFKSFPQTPHFRPLLESKEVCREGTAIGMMVTYDTLVDKIFKLDYMSPRSTFDYILEGLLDIEKYGFDVTVQVDRVKKLLLIKDEEEQYMASMEKAESEIIEYDKLKTKVNLELEAIRNQIGKLAEEFSTKKLEHKASDLEISRLKLKIHDLKEHIEQAPQKFQNLARDPWKSSNE